MRNRNVEYVVILLQVAWCNLQRSESRDAVEVSRTQYIISGIISWKRSAEWACESAWTKVSAAVSLNVFHMLL